MQFQTGITYTINGSLTVQGSSSNYVVLEGTIAAVWTVANVGNSESITYADVTDSTATTNQMDTTLSGRFEFSRQLTSAGEWRVLADWVGDSEYEPAKSEVLMFRAISGDIPEGSEETVPVVSPGQAQTSEAAQKAGNFLKKNVMIIGLLALYVVIIRLYKS